MDRPIGQDMDYSQDLVEEEAVHHKDYLEGRQAAGMDFDCIDWGMDSAAQVHFEIPLVVLNIKRIFFIRTINKNVLFYLLYISDNQLLSQTYLLMITTSTLGLANRIRRWILRSLTCISWRYMKAHWLITHFGEISQNVYLILMFRITKVTSMLLVNK